MSNNNVFHFRNYEFDIKKFKPNKITKYELLCAIEKINKAANYYREISLEKSVKLLFKISSVISLVYTFVILMIMIDDSDQIKYWWFMIFIAIMMTFILFIVFISVGVVVEIFILII